MALFLVLLHVITAIVLPALSVDYIDHVSCGLNTNIDLTTADVIYSLDGSTRFGLSSEGELRLQVHTRNWTTQWNNNKSPGPNTVLAIQVDGNLVVYESGNAYWASISNNAQSPHHLVVSNDGEAYMLNSNNIVTWSTSGATSGLPTFAAPTIATSFPSYMPTVSPTNVSKYPTTNPSTHPSHFPSNYPTVPTTNPSNIPSTHPSQFPSNYPTTNPTLSTNNPSANPSHFPSNYPTKNPSIIPTNDPSKIPSHSASSNEVDIEVNWQETTISTEYQHESFSAKNDEDKGMIIGIVSGLTVIILIILSMFIYYHVARRKRLIESEQTNITAQMQMSDNVTTADVIDELQSDADNDHEDIIKVVNKTHDGSHPETIHATQGAPLIVTDYDATNNGLNDNSHHKETMGETMDDNVETVGEIGD
eukprot:351607_1